VKAAQEIADRVKATSSSAIRRHYRSKYRTSAHSVKLTRPFVILGNGMELGEVKGNGPDYRSARMVNKVGFNDVRRHRLAHCISAFITCCSPNRVGHRLDPARNNGVM